MAEQAEWYVLLIWGEFKGQHIPYMEDVAAPTLEAALESACVLFRNGDKLFALTKYDAAGNATALMNSDALYDYCDAQRLADDLADEPPYGRPCPDAYYDNMRAAQDMQQVSA